MRISDWSSDGALPILRSPREIQPSMIGLKNAKLCSFDSRNDSARAFFQSFFCNASDISSKGPSGDNATFWSSKCAARSASAESRSEEHTSELQSLMRISYSVFCLQKKNEQKKKQNTK